MKLVPVLVGAMLSSSCRGGGAFEQQPASDIFRRLQLEQARDQVLVSTTTVECGGYSFPRELQGDFSLKLLGRMAAAGADERISFYENSVRECGATVTRLVPQEAGAYRFVEEEVSIGSDVRCTGHGQGVYLEVLASNDLSGTTNCTCVSYQVLPEQNEVILTRELLDDSPSCDVKDCPDFWSDYHTEHIYVMEPSSNSTTPFEAIQDESAWSCGSVVETACLYSDFTWPPELQGDWLLKPESPDRGIGSMNFSDCNAVTGSTTGSMVEDISFIIDERFCVGEGAGVVVEVLEAQAGLPDPSNCWCSYWEVDRAKRTLFYSFLVSTDCITSNCPTSRGDYETQGANEFVLSDEMELPPVQDYFCSAEGPAGADSAADKEDAQTSIAEDSLVSQKAPPQGPSDSASGSLLSGGAITAIVAVSIGVVMAGVLVTMHVKKSHSRHFRMEEDSAVEVPVI
jgi:hypothetical protein